MILESRHGATASSSSSTTEWPQRRSPSTTGSSQWCSTRAKTEARQAACRLRQAACQCKPKRCGRGCVNLRQCEANLESSFPIFCKCYAFVSEATSFPRSNSDSSTHQTLPTILRVSYSHVDVTLTIRTSCHAYIAITSRTQSLLLNRSLL